MTYLYLVIILSAALLVLVLWYALVVGWALILRRMAQSVSTWDELEEDMRGELDQPGDPLVGAFDRLLELGGDVGVPDRKQKGRRRQPGARKK
jgi:hypothetical protein